MFAINLIHRTGGSFAIVCKTMQECRDKADNQCKVWPGSYIAATIPYAVFKVPGMEAYDVSIPFEIKKSLGMEIRFLLDE